MAVPTPRKRSEEETATSRRRRALTLSATFVLYLVFGGFTFSALESCEQSVTISRPAPLWKELEEWVGNSSGITEESSKEVNTSDVVGSSWVQLKRDIAGLCSGSNNTTELQLDTALEETRLGVSTVEQAQLLCGPGGLETSVEVKQVPWSFVDAVFFCMTVITTIGYGHISPSSAGGMMFCIFYSVIGIPISGLLLAGLSDFFADSLLRFYDNKWRKKRGDSKWPLVTFTAASLAVGFLAFVFVPAALFSWLEDWNYVEAVYFCFVTLSTIGFGDYTAGIVHGGALGAIYKLGIMLWVLVGLGYWVLVLNFIQKALKSKEVKRTLTQTTRIIAREAEELKLALANAGILQREAVFVPEHSKHALSMMMSMGSALAGGVGPAGGGDDGDTRPAPTGLKGITSMGSCLQSNSLLQALMQSLPTVSDEQETPGSLTPASDGSATPLPAETARQVAPVWRSSSQVAAPSRHMDQTVEPPAEERSLLPQP